MSGKITIALAGLGSRGKDTYAQAVKKFPEKMEIVAIADIDPAKVPYSSGKMFYKCGGSDCTGQAC